jgi:hypothetical protein
MAAFSDFSENKLIDWLFRAQAIGITGASAAAGTGPSNLYIGLLSANPTDSTPGTEVSGNNYSRVVVASSLTNWAGTQGAGTTTASSGNTGTTSNNVQILFPTPTPAGWGVVTGVGIYDAATGGNLLIYSALTNSKTVNVGDTVPFPAAALAFQLDN